MWPHSLAFVRGHRQLYGVRPIARIRRTYATPSSESKEVVVSAAPRPDPSGHPHATNFNQSSPSSPSGSDASTSNAKNVGTSLPPTPSSSGGTRTPVATAPPPFHTHEFFRELERVFPTPVARVLMRCTRAMLVDRVNRVRSSGITHKDLDNDAYLFRAALSELRSESTMSKAQALASVQTASSVSRRELDALDSRIKEHVATLKHELQMELDNRKNEARTDVKRTSITIEELLHKTLVTLGDLRTINQEIQWHNMRRAVLTLGAFAVMIIASMELRPPPPPPPPPRHSPAEMKQPEAEGLEPMGYVT